MVIVPRCCLSCRAVPVREVRTSERRDHRYSDGAVPVRGDRHAVGTHEHGLADRA